eukprot:6002691-Pyramimonas_sp.AAC.1
MQREHERTAGGEEREEKKGDEEEEEEQQQCFISPETAESPTLTTAGLRHHVQMKNAKVPNLQERPGGRQTAEKQTQAKKNSVATTTRPTHRRTL